MKLYTVVGQNLEHNVSKMEAMFGKTFMYFSSALKYKLCMNTLTKFEISNYRTDIAVM